MRVEEQDRKANQSSDSVSTFTTGLFGIPIASTKHFPGEGGFGESLNVRNLNGLCQQFFSWSCADFVELSCGEKWNRFKLKECADPVEFSFQFAFEVTIAGRGFDVAGVVIEDAILH